jgi:class 3 adenylate cyclase
MRGEIRDISSGRGKDPATPRVGTPRRLAAIVVGDICGYSRLMELDEEGTHARVRRIERDLIEPSIRGRSCGGSCAIRIGSGKSGR